MDGTTEKVQQVADSYPENLLAEIVKSTKLVPPSRVTDDVRAGISYAISTLDPQAIKVLQLRYVEKKTRSEISKELSVSIDQARQIEIKAIRRLRYVSKWGYMRYGIQGYTQQVGQQKYQEGFNNGYLDGYKNGIQDGRDGKAPFIGPEDVLRLPIECLKVSTKVKNCLRWSKCATIGELAALDADKIWVIRNLGKTGINEIAGALRDLGIGHTDWDRFPL